MSKFLDLKELKVHKVYNYTAYCADLGDANDLLNSSVADLKTLIYDSFNLDDELIASADAILFDVEIQKCENIDDFESLVRNITDKIFALITSDEEREREHRYGAPKNLRNYLNCNQVPLQKAVNNKCKIDVFTIYIHDTINGWEFELVHE